MILALRNCLKLMWAQFDSSKKNLYYLRLDLFYYIVTALALAYLILISSLLFTD